MAGRVRSIPGVTVLLAARVLMIGCGYATYALVARALTTADFGVYGVITAVVNVLNTVLGTGTNQAISLLVSRHPDTAPALFSWGRWWSVSAAVVVALGLGAGAPLLASMLRDSSLTPLLMIVALSPGFYALNATYLGFLNGTRAFARQGVLNIVLSVSRLILISGAAALGYGVRGTSYGVVIAGLVGAMLAGPIAKIERTSASAELQPRAFARILFGFVGVAVLLQLLLSADLLLIKRFLPASAANQQAGIYTAAQTIARIPFFLLIGVSQSAYPKLSARTAGKGSGQSTSTLVLSGLIVILAGLLAVSVPLASRLILFIYPARYAEGGAVLGWLLCGSAALSLAEASLTMLSGAAGPRPSALVLAIAVLLQVVLCCVWIPRHGVIGAAHASLVAALLAAVAAAVWLGRTVGMTVSTRLVGSAVLPALALAVAATFFAGMGLGFLLTAGFVLAAYGGYLLAIYLINARSLKLFSDLMRSSG